MFIMITIWIMLRMRIKFWTGSQKQATQRSNGGDTRYTQSTS